MQRSDRDMPWSLKGVRPEVREMAKAAAAKAGLPVGAWLSMAIRTVGEAELRNLAPPAQPPQPPAAPALRPALPAADADVEPRKLLDPAATGDGGD